jgi:hypothetical protein
MKTQWDIATHPLEWLKLERLVIPSIDKDMEQMQIYYTGDGNMKWYNK